MDDSASRAEERRVLAARWVLPVVGEPIAEAP